MCVFFVCVLFEGGGGGYLGTIPQRRRQQQGYSEHHDTHVAIEVAQAWALPYMDIQRTESIRTHRGMLMIKDVVRFCGEIQIGRAITLNLIQEGNQKDIRGIVNFISLV